MSIVVAIHYLALAFLCAFGVQRLVATVQLLRCRPAALPPAPGALPHVTVQLPMYNEVHVAERVIRAAAALEYPADRLQIQVVDDSDDATAQRVDSVAAALRDDGHRVDVVRRTTRGGFKAGALAHALDSADGELIAIFDADFVPPARFLLDTVGHFSDPQVGLVQTRWGHLNRDFSLWTLAQSVLLDGHFVVEQTARACSGAPFNFNGTAGVWRRNAIDDAGGWQSDTITEDLDLSYRAQLAGWRFVYRPDIVAEAELPVDAGGLLSQQHRWAKGSIECLRKLASPIARSDWGVRRRAAALFHLCANLSYVAAIVVAATLPVVTRARQFSVGPELAALDATLLALGFGAVALFYAAAARGAGLGVLRAAVAVPAAIALDVGLSAHKARAALEGIVGHRTEFVRTPKLALVRRSDRDRTDSYIRRARAAGMFELVLAGWMVWGFAQIGGGPFPTYATAPFLVLFGVGYGLVGGAAFAQYLPAPRSRAHARIGDAAGAAE
ncbi:MAG: glycosyltransferase [Myxococcales bacterium]|nr:glycosyltransferase [Myxococcales bacterium]